MTRTARRRRPKMIALALLAILLLALVAGPNAGRAAESDFVADTPPAVDVAPSDPGGPAPSAATAPAELPIDPTATPTPTPTPAASDPASALPVDETATVAAPTETPAVPEVSTTPADAAEPPTTDPSGSPAAEPAGAPDPAIPPPIPAASDATPTTEVAAADIALGTVQITRLDAAGNLALGACFALNRTGIDGSACDGGVFGGVPTGATLFSGTGVETIYETRQPAGAGYVGPFTVTFVPGTTIDVTLRPDAAAGVVVVPTDDAGGALHITFACYELHEDAGGGTPGALVDRACLSAYGLGSTARLNASSGGDYVIVEIPPSYLTNYTPAADAVATLVGGTLVTVAMPHSFVSAKSGELRIGVVDQNGQPLPTCFRLTGDKDPNGRPYDRSDCDTQVQDGRLRFYSLVPGTYHLTETRAGEPPRLIGYGTVADQDVVITAGEATALSFQLLPTEATVQVVACSFATDGAARTQIDVLVKEPAAFRAAAVAPDPGCVPTPGFDAVFTTDGGGGSTLTTDANGRADGSLPPAAYTVAAGGVTIGQTLRAGDAYLFFVQRFVASADLPIPTPPTAGTPGAYLPREGDKGTLEIFAFACTGGAPGSQLVAFPPDAPGTRNQANPLSPTSRPGSGFVPAGSTGADCAPAAATVRIDDGDPFVVDAGRDVYDVPAGRHTLTEVCAGAQNAIEIVSGQVTKALVLNPAACPVGAETTPAAAFAATSTPGGPVTALPDTGAGEPQSTRVPAVLSLLLSALALAAPVGGAIRRRRRAA